ncbi:MAG: FKBP-type peptidyl-prolyl cis-trans isomerase SlyD [Candidatus Celerinatantimonas neptuna]|nr:MAG: FKBP-type peptidyl-prolyl cis-trans isomerase SlyD [Candidatus Celerinatantimonas neptuna]
MKIAENKVALIHYTVSAQGTELDSSKGKEPLSYIAGQGFLVPGLEEALMGHEAGENLDVEVNADKAYGQRDEHLMQSVPRSMFEGIEVESGMQFRASTDAGEQTVMVLEVNDDEVVVDGNHPLAGMDLFFNVSIEDVRDATAEELEHGHVHGQGCCGGHGEDCDHDHQGKGQCGSDSCCCGHDH